MVVPFGPDATAPTRTAAFVIAHSSARPIGTRSLKPALEISGSYRKTPSPRRLVVIEFENFDPAKRWYNSPEYQAALQGRLRTAVSQVLVVDGI